MRLVEVFIENPVKVAVCVILLVLFGLLTITPPSIAPSPIRVPVQLTPNLDEPVVTVSTSWEGASPEDVEREIIEPQEEVLKSITKLHKLTADCSQGSGTITLEFEVGTDQDVAKQDVSDALRRVKYQIPINEFDNPTVQSGRPFGEEAIAWMILSSDRPDLIVPELFTFVDEDVKPILERVEGISSIGIFGGREREIQVAVDPRKLAQSGVTFSELQTALQSQNTNVSAGNSAQGKRDIVIRTMGQFASLEEIRQTVIKTGPGGPIRVGRVAEVKDSFKRRYGFVRSEGKEVLALPAYRETGSNVIEVMEGLRAAIEKVNREVLAHRDLKIELTQVYDETTYIKASIGLVRDNIWYGGILAIGVLLVFLRSISATTVVAVSIPISIIGTFLVIPLAGRNINVVMLAGLAFATGMVVDNAIVVLENIFRHREMGKSKRQAAADGSSEVWGAVLANTLTTVVVFLPIIFVQGEAGQLFRDIAIAISGAVGLSLLVSVTVIPPLASRILGRPKVKENESSKFADTVARTVAWINHTVLRRAMVILLITGGSVLLSWKMAPDPSYLPAGNQNLIFGFLVTPPGYNVNEFTRIAEKLENGDPEKGIVGIRPFWEVDLGTPEYEKLLADWSKMVESVVVPGFEAQIAQANEQMHNSELSRKERRQASLRVRELKREIAEWRVPPPPIDNFFYVAFGGGVFMGCSSKDPEVVRPLENVLNSTGFSVPDAFAIFFQTSIFRGVGSSNSVEIEIRGDRLDEVVDAARHVMMACMERFGSRPEATPTNFMLDRREDQLVPDRVRAGDVGLTVADIGNFVRACGDGRVVGQYRESGKSIDLAIKIAGTEDPTSGANTTARIAQTPLFTPTGQIVPLAAVCDIVNTTSPQQISHIETQRAVKLTVRPPEGLSLPEVIDVINHDIVDAMRGDGYGPMKAKISPGVIVGLAGNADKLKTTWDSLKWLLGLSFLITYLLMAGLFESFAYPFVIIFTVPFAVVGGFAGLALMNAWTWADPGLAIQQLDMLTILGFVILLGIVVNNGILIVHQALNFMSYGMQRDAAIYESVRTRIRPILMTVLTTFFAQIPLVIRPGSGAELYRGLGAVVLGGLLMSTVFTLIVVPAMLSLSIGARVHLGRVLFGRSRNLPVTGASAAVAPRESSISSIERDVTTTPGVG
ncbi:MAG: efflux RND transporter permease subunit [Planctomycetia bacterium]|nr:efflux RND transporter permease subunit [Planctomycetia bacterium]MCC7313672.1 efflux RND transporter permease subunit [Planctomycetota bacterium]